MTLRINFFGEAEILLFADGEESLNGIYLGDGGQYGQRADEVADLNLGDSSDSVNKGRDVREAKI